MIRIDKDSHGTVILAWALNLAFIFILFIFCRHSAALYASCGLLLGFAIFETAFFRVPERTRTDDPKNVTSVADGEVVIIEKSFESEFLNAECLRICIYMDFFDVHANFWPVSGEVTYCKHHKGKHILAFKPKSSVENEHSTTAIRTEDGQSVLFKQIAGSFARRVVSYSEPGLQVNVGEQCGIIKLGSRIDMYLPLSAKVNVTIGQKVRACETSIAELA